MRDWLKEFVLMLYYPIADRVRSIWKYREENQDQEYNPTKPTIVIIKRWFNHNPLHIERKQYLASKGFNVYFIFHPLSRGTWEESAQSLATFIENKKLKDITLVGISGGGITALLFLHDYNGWNNVHTFISVATPFGGVLWELLLSFNRSCRQLLPWTSFVQKLQTYTKPAGKHFYSIRAKADEMVGKDSAIHPAAEEIVVSVSGHNNLHLYSNKPYDTIAELAHNPNRSSI